jgi:hypothetical protein
MKTKALKLPDGGTIDVAIPADFGSPILALNDAGNTHRNPWIVYGIGAGLGLLCAYLWLDTTRKA